MSVVVERGQEELILQTVRKRLAQKKASAGRNVDIISWGERNFFIPEIFPPATKPQPIVFEPHQKATLLYAFPAAMAFGFRFSTVVFSTIKKSGKTAIAGLVARWVAEERTRAGEIYALGNDLDQAKDRAFAAVHRSISLTPGYRQNNSGEGVLPEKWVCQKTAMDCIATGTRIKALSVDARGEAGANPDLTVWTELWGFEYPDAIKFFEEMTQTPTKPSCRFVETYAGFDGESMLLHGIYEQGVKEGRQLTAGELAADTGIPLGAFVESPNEDDLVPIWVNERQGLFLYWDSGETARRMMWQLGGAGEKYYAEQEANLTPNNYLRIHHNLWVGSEGDFIPLDSWDACFDPSLPMLEPGDKTPCVVGVDAATTGDCFGIVVVTRNPANRADVAVRQTKKWDPPKGGRIDYEGPEAFLRTICKGGCAMGHPQMAPFLQAPETCPHRPAEGRACKECCPACRDGSLIPPLNVVQIAYDPYQLESMMQKFRKEHVAWCKEFSQGGERMEADKALYDLIVNRRLVHRGEPALREHIANSAARQGKHEDTKLRIIKKPSGKKVDLAVAASMACHQCLYLMLG